VSRYLLENPKGQREGTAAGTAPASERCCATTRPKGPYVAVGAGHLACQPMSW
jgi:hypothetical protein